MYFVCNTPVVGVCLPYLCDNRWRSVWIMKRRMEGREERGDEGRGGEELAYSNDRMDFKRGGVVNS